MFFAILAMTFTAVGSAFAAAPSASRSGGYPDYAVGETAVLTITTSPAQAHQPVYRFRYKNGLPDGDQPTEIGTTDAAGVFTASALLEVDAIGAYAEERFAVGDSGGPKSNALSFDVHAANPPSSSRPAPFPSYTVGDLTSNTISTSPAQPHQPVYRFRFKNGAPDGDQPTYLGHTDAAGRLQLEGTLTVDHIGSYSDESFAVGTEGGPRSSAESYTVQASNPPTANRSAPFPEYRVGDLATLNLSTS
ncbi:MAG: hypothetical protein MI919_25105, partial [Holophagales bacterium]|nr:hypothetical protein [Holophagales bacterium]